MINIRQYQKAQSLEEAWTLNQKKANRIIGGMGWMKMSNGNVGTAIDLSGLGLDQIQETEEEFVIGAMVSLRQFELHQGLNSYFNNAVKESVKHIVGIQFRNCATIGGSVWLRPGFSDPLTLLLALDSTVELYTGSEEHTLIPLPEFCQMKKDNSILVAVHIKKDGRKVVYESFRNTETDFPVLTAAVARTDASYVASVGARPSAARLVCADTVEELTKKAQELTYQSNIRASADYRCMLAGVLIGKAAGRLDQ